ncbi:uncharacterized protein [Battus philenor]|uniref:uncharacterized protein n=1 Tax=Battus philenor TaxID=42288 RepID=UPI0035CF13B3
MWKTIQANVRQDLEKMVPLSILNDINCFVFYDNHPQGSKTIDILVCTQHGEIIEYYQREKNSSILFNTTQKFREVRSFRNRNCELFYLAATEDELYILSSKDKLVLEHRLTEVESYEIFDHAACGRASLKVMCKDDAVPLYFDDNFMSVAEICFNHESLQSESVTPIVIQLTRKLTELKYRVKCNEKKYNEYLNLRQVATFCYYQNICPNLDESLFSINTNEIALSMNLKTSTPWVKLCNKKLVIAFKLYNKNDVTLEQVYVLLNSCSMKSMIYTTKILEKDQTLWTDCKNQSVKPNIEVTIATIIDIRELENYVNNKVEFDMTVAFKKCGINYLLPFEKIMISVCDFMKEDFDVLAIPQKDEEYTFLAVLATCEKIELYIRIIHEEDESSFNAADIFCNYLKMEEFATNNNVLIHRTSPYHALNGVMVIFQDDELSNGDQFTVAVYSRCPSQVLALIHYINDVVPFRVIATTANYKITSNVEELACYNEETTLNSNQGINYSEYGASVLNQISVLLEYLDNCMIKMNECKNQATIRKIGNEIDIFACGLEKFKEFRKKLLNGMYSGIEKSLTVENPFMTHGESAEMSIDEDDD